MKRSWTLLAVAWVALVVRAGAGQIAVIVLELEVGRAFTTLPVSPID